MGDATLKPSSGDDLVLSNDDGSAKIEVNEAGTVVITGTTTLSGSSEQLLFNTASGVNAGYLTFASNSSAIGFLGGGQGLGASATDFVLRGTNNIKFNIGVSTKATLDSSGNFSFGDNNITNVGDISLDTISSDSGTSIGVTLGTDAGDDFNVGSGKLVVEGDTGNVGIGTSDPSSYDSAQDNLVIKGTGNEGMSIISGASSNSTIAFGSGTGASGYQGMIAYLNADSAMTFRTQAVERMRIISGGQIRILCANMGANPSSSNSGVFIGNTSTGSSFYGGGTGTETHFIFGNPNGVVGTVQTSGSSTAFNTSSDYRLKENVTSLTGAIERINQLKPSRFNFIKDPDTTMDGFLAHEVSDYVPEAITGEKDAMTTEEFVETEAVFDEEGNEISPAIIGTREVIDPQGIDQSKLVPLIVASIQELSAKVNALEGA